MFNFNFGKKKPDIKQYAVVAIILSSIIGILSQCTHIPTNKLWDLLDEIQRKYFPQTIINDFIILDPEKLDRRVKRDVDRAVDDYWRQTGEKPVEIPAPILSEKPVDESVCYSEECKKLGGEMRICAPWIESCVSDPYK
jgi:hypothetical protein